MNIRYHAAVAVIVDVALSGHGLFAAVSLAPDLTLAFNEYRLIKTGRTFDPTEVDRYTLFAYRLAHSFLLTLALLLIFDWRFACSHLSHILPDLFTHTGIFAARPLYPLSKLKVEGWEMLK